MVLIKDIFLGMKYFLCEVWIFSVVILKGNRFVMNYDKNYYIIKGFKLVLCE